MSFSQNIRNGSNFLVFNTELRWPIFRYLAGHPLSSGFLNNFQVVGFADIGTAWTGLHPFSDENAWNTEVIVNGPMTITIDANRDPIIAGYGVGMRAHPDTVSMNDHGMPIFLYILFGKGHGIH